MNGISTVVPVYNTAEYLRRCIDSILNQQNPPEEIFLVNDGSTDGSDMICQEYAQRYPALIRVINQENQGLSAARNAGIEAARGEYLSFIDSDDYIELQESDG